jgi:hypothetical protein
VGGGGDHVAVLERGRGLARCHQPADVGHVGHQQRPAPSNPNTRREEKTDHLFDMVFINYILMFLKQHPLMTTVNGFQRLVGRPRWSVTRCEERGSG